MQHFVQLDATGFPVAFYNDAVFPPVITYGEPPEPTEDDPTPVAPIVSTARNPGIPADVLPITEEQWIDAVSNPGQRKWDATAATFVEAQQPPPPLPPAPPGPVRILKVDLWRRTTEAEAEALDGLLKSQPVRLQRMFNDATVISSADDMWPLLSGAIANALGAARAAELLAPSE